MSDSNSVLDDLRRPRFIFEPKSFDLIANVFLLKGVGIEDGIENKVTVSTGLSLLDEVQPQDIEKIRGLIARLYVELWGSENIKVIFVNEFID